MYITEAKELLASVYENARGFIVPCLLGDPGIGKSQVVYQLAKELNVNVVEIIASQILPNEVSGITMPVNETHSMEIYDHAKLSSLKDGDILFFDELLQASPQTLAACLTLLQERKLLSGYKLPDIMIVAAANPLNSPQQIPLSIRQRFMFFDVDFSTSHWKSYMEDKGFDPYLVEIALRYINKSDDTGYNYLTPRSAEKFLTWFTRASRPMDILLNVEPTLMSPSFRDELKNYFRSIEVEKAAKAEREMSESMFKEARSVAIECSGDDIVLADTLGDCDSFEELIEVLKAHNAWDKISQELEKISVNDVKERIENDRAS